MKKIFLLKVFFASLALNAVSQNSLDSLLSSLNNADLYIAPILYNPWEPKKVRINKDSARLNKRLFIVSSIDEDIQELAKKYSKKLLIEKLVVLLQDTARDLYANALLYDLLENRNLGKLMFMKRQEWICSGRRSCDIAYWQDYLQKQTYFY